jgi:hypothetical protein
MNEKLKKVEEAIDDINPSKTLRTKVIKLIISIAVWLIPHL